MNRKIAVQWGTIVPKLDELSVAHRAVVIVMLAGVLVLSQPHIALAAEKSSNAFVFEIKQENLNHFRISLFDLETPLTDEQVIAVSQVILSKVETADEITFDPRVGKLKEYLIKKKSPLAPYVDELLEQKHYRLILGISFAESNFCKHQIRPRNCWGIGGTNPETYKSYDEAFIRANNLIQKYHDSGLTTPKLMRNRWVGWKNDSWIRAVEQATRDLETLGI